MDERLRELERRLAAAERQIDALQERGLRGATGRERVGNWPPS